MGGVKTYRVRFSLSKPKAIEAYEKVRAERYGLISIVIQQAVEHFFTTQKGADFLEANGIPMFAYTSIDEGAAVLAEVKEHHQVIEKKAMTSGTADIPDAEDGGCPNGGMVLRVDELFGA